MRSQEQYGCQDAKDAKDAKDAEDARDVRSTNVRLKGMLWRPFRNHIKPSGEYKTSLINTIKHSLRKV